MQFLFYMESVGVALRLYFRQRYVPFIRHRRRSQTVFAIYKINLDNAKNGAIIKTY